MSINNDVASQGQLQPTTPRDSSRQLTPRTPRSPRSPSSSPSRTSFSTPLSPHNHPVNTIQTIASNNIDSLNRESDDIERIMERKVDLIPNGYTLRYPFLKAFFDEIDEFNKSRGKFSFADKLVQHSHSRGVLGLSQTDNHPFGEGKAMHNLKKLLQQSKISASTYEEGSLSTFTTILKTLDAKQTAMFFNTLETLTASKNASLPFHTFENHISKAYKFPSCNQELQVFETVLNKFSSISHQQFAPLDALVKEASKEFQEDRRLALQALIHLLKTLCSKEGKASSSSLHLNDSQQMNAQSILEEVRGIYEEEVNGLIPFQSIAHLLESIFTGEKGKSSSAPNSREPTPRIPSSLSTPEVSTQRPRAPSYPPRRSSPTLLRKKSRDAKVPKNYSGEKSKTESTSTLQKIAERFSPAKIPNLPIGNFANFATSSKSEELSPKTPSPKVTFEMHNLDTAYSKEIEALKEGLQSEGKLDKKSVKHFLKKIETLIDPSLPLQEYDQRILQLEFLLNKIVEHKSFKAVFQENSDLYDIYLSLHVKARYGGTLHTFLQFQDFSSEFLKLLQEKNVPQGFSVDLYGQEVDIYSWFNPQTHFPSSWFSGMKLLKSPGERFRIKITEYNLELMRITQVFEKHHLDADTVQKFREMYPQESKIFVKKDHDFIKALYRYFGKERFLKNENAISTDKTLILILDKILFVEDKHKFLSSLRCPLLELILKEFGDEIREIKTQNNLNIKVIKDLVLHLQGISEDFKVDYQVRVLLEHPYIDVQKIVSLLSSSAHKNLINVEENNDHTKTQ